MVKEGVSHRRDRGFASLRFRQVAPPTDEAFISRLAIRRLQTHLLYDHFLGSVMVAARNPSADKWAVSSRQKLFRQNVEELRRDLQELVVETVTDERHDLSIFQVVCLPTGDPHAESLAAEVLLRSDAVDVVSNLPQLIERLPSELLW